MRILTDIYLQHEIDTDQLAQVTVDTLGLEEDSVSIATAGTAQALAALRNPTMSVVYQREQDDQPGDFPVRYVLNVHIPGEPFIQLLSSLAHHLNVAILTDISMSPGDDDWKLFLPDGTFHVVELDPEAFDNDALVLQEKDRADLARSLARSPRRVAA